MPNLSGNLRDLYDGQIFNGVFKTDAFDSVWEEDRENTREQTIWNYRTECRCKELEDCSPQGNRGANPQFSLIGNEQLLQTRQAP